MNEKTPKPVNLRREPTMSDAFPIEIPESLPIRITPCPIVEAVFETRFVSPEPWATMPGLLFAQIRAKYPEQKTLPMAQIPEDLRQQNPMLMILPEIQFLSDNFIIQLGPRVVSLVTKADAYPGWRAIADELKWLVEQVKKAGFVGETERLGTRYTDFFRDDVFNGLRLGVQVNERPLKGVQTEIATILKRGRLSIRLQVTNGAIVKTKDGAMAGSVVDVDGWFEALDADLFLNGMSRFEEAHDTIKGLFFGLLKPELLSTLNPEYE